VARSWAGVLISNSEFIGNKVTAKESLNFRNAKDNRAFGSKTKSHLTLFPAWKRVFRGAKRVLEKGEGF
jgi:hypothetical protein